VRNLQAVVVLLGLVGGCGEEARYPASTRGEPVVSRAGAPVNANAGAAVTPPAGLADEAACDPYAVRPLGSHWTPFTDDGCASEDTTSVVRAMWQGDEPRRCESQWTATVPGDSGAFAGIESEVMPDLSSLKAVRFQVRGPGRSVRAQFASREQLKEGAAGTDRCKSDWYDFYGEVLSCGDGTAEWRDVELTLAELKQRGWGRAVPRKPEDWVRFQIVTEERPVEAFECEIRGFELVFADR
jgi:hypothetical protein